MALSGALCGAGGSFYAQYYLYIDPSVAFGVDKSVEMLLVTMIGVIAPCRAVAQTGTTARTGAFFESYSIGSGLGFRRISEFTIPISVTQRFGDRLAIDVGTAFTRASADVGGNTIDHSGLVDTDLRATIGVIPGRLVFNLVGTIPTGATAVPDTWWPVWEEWVAQYAGGEVTALDRYVAAPDPRVSLRADRDHPG